MNLTPKTTTYGDDSKAWLGSQHGTDTADSVTLDPTLMLAAFADGRVPSGVLLGKVSATGRYGPYDDAALDGRAVAEGLLFDAVLVTAAQNAGGALLWHGEVVEANLPASSGVDAAGKANLTHIHFV